MGGGWLSDPDGRRYRRLKEKTGCKIAFLLYDLIPILRPHYFPAATAHAYQRWFDAMARITADYLIRMTQ